MLKQGVAIKMEVGPSAPPIMPMDAAEGAGAEFLTVHEGLCVQAIHIGSYGDEPATVAKMNEYILKMGYTCDITAERLHHEIYISDARKVEPAKRKTVVRQPIKKKQ